MKVFFVAVVGTASLMLSNLSGLEVQGHRGTRGLYPENTLPAFEYAIKTGADVLELDLQVTEDGEIVVHHDYHLSKATCCQYKIKNDPSLLIKALPLSEVKSVDVGSKKNCSFPRLTLVPGTTVPTLDELFTFIENSSDPQAQTIKLNLEIKRDPAHPEWSIDVKQLASKVVDKVRERGFTDRVYYSSFDPEVLAKIRSCDPKAKLGLIFGKESLARAQQQYPENPLELLLQIANFLKVSVISPEHSLVEDQSLVEKLQGLGFQIIPWTSNTPEEWERLTGLGVDGIITDYPSDLVEFLKQKGLR